jgi:dihydroflavonol-4-reductase
VTIVVTGASGHIGANLVRSLVDAGAKVRVTVHKSTAALEGLDVERVPADLLDPASLEKAFREAEMVYHLAAFISLVRHQADRLQAVNVEGTRNVVEAALKCKVRRLVHVSSIEALLHPERGDPIEEADPPLPESISTLYGRTKAQGELIVLEAVKRSLDAVIVYPTAVVGGHDYAPSDFGQMFLDFGRTRLPALVTGGFDLVDVRDLVDGIQAAGKSGKTGERYILSGEYMTVGEISEALEDNTVARRPRLTVPYWIAYPAAFFTPLYYRLSGTRPRFTRMSLKILHDKRRVSHEKATRELGYTPRNPREGIKAAVEWFGEAGMLHPTFRSRKDPGIVMLAVFVLAACLLGGLALLIVGRGWQHLLGLAGMILGGLYAWLTMPVIYEITDKQLLVRGGPFRWKIHLDSILEVYPSRLPISAPAWSWKRLRVDYRKKDKDHFVLISPSDPKKFLTKLAEASPGLERTGDSLRRPPAEHVKSSD